MLGPTMPKDAQAHGAIWRDDGARYGRVSRLLHWLTLLLLVLSVPLAIVAADLPASPERLILLTLHRSLGVAVMLILLLRLPWRVYNGWPQTGPNPWLAKAARLNHLALYALLAGAIVGGWAYTSASAFAVGLFGLFVLPPLLAPDKELAEILRQVHQVTVYALLALIAVHALAALYHQHMLKDGTLRRMWGK
ncbi:MAG TPA: cytochrome b/b6 domain-containing protein [Alphaproteobacteria bacterium]|nr:cytochrome b/b6 domain-containing protein [Alphaproteobacteria bacterium]